jgi:hypothetical protein
MEHEETERGVIVTETSEDPYVASLIKAHAKVVSAFVERGFDEARKNHPVPGAIAPPTTPATAKIDGYGKVVQLPNAAHQPREGAKLCVDVTKSEDPDKLNSAIEKVARYVNIYAGAGAQPANAEIAVILHDGATLAVLNADAYSKKFGTQGNPNLDCLQKLHEAGVKIYVCGQSLISKGGTPEDVVVFVDVSVSALTSLANLQADGFAYLPLLK